MLEHVEGEPIDRYCDRQGLGIEARLQLFLDVLAVVAHAHANLVVHRNLKSPNVLVSSGDEVVVEFSLFVRYLLYLRLGELACAVDLARELEARLPRVPPAGHPAFAVLASQQGLPSAVRGDVSSAVAAQTRALTAQGRSAEAQTALASALSHLEPTLGADHPETRAARQLELAAGTSAPAASVISRLP